MGTSRAGWERGAGHNSDNSGNVGSIYNSFSCSEDRSVMFVVQLGGKVLSLTSVQREGSSPGAALACRDAIR